ncbi:PREDICTED: tensin-3-like, partial [Eurypyga helias]|uniref:tensin-3-like n=1 Tax=Eurypyga helias TaxID=54383 RepID=UPI0005289654
MRWTRSRKSTSLLFWGAQKWAQSSTCGFTSAKQRGRITSLDLLAAQDIVDHLCHEVALLAHGRIHQDPQVLPYGAVFQPVGPPAYLLRKPNPTIQVVNEGVEQYWPRYQPLGYLRVTCLLVNVVRLITSLWAQPFSQFSVHLTVHVPGPCFVSFFMRMLQKPVVIESGLTVVSASTLSSCGCNLTGLSRLTYVQFGLNASLLGPPPRSVRPGTLNLVVTFRDDDVHQLEFTTYKDLIYISSATERPWLESSPKASPSLQLSMGNTRPPGGYLVPAEFANAVQDVSLLSHFQTPGLQVVTLSSLESSPAETQREPAVSSSAQAYLSYGGGNMGGSSPQEEKQAAFIANTSISPKTMSSLVAGAEDNGFLTQNFLAAASGHGSQNSAVQQQHGGNIHAQPPLPEKKRSSEGDRSFASVSPSSSGFSSPHSGSTISIPFPNVLPDFSKMLSTSPVPENTTDKHVTVKFVQDTSKFWYKPDISREQAIAVLKDKEPGSFIVRDSHSFRGAYGLAMKVATPPPSVLQLNKKVGDLSNELVRHFLIECTHKGVRLKGCPNEPYFGSLTALVYQHSITPLALPCKLLIPDRDPLEEIAETSPQTAANSAAELLKQGAACNVWYLNSVEMESLTGYQAVQKALSLTLMQDPSPTSTVVHFKVSAQGITLTDNQR